MKPLPELASFLEGLAEPHILFDTQYRILAANAAYRQQFSPDQSIIGRTCYEVSHHFDRPCDLAGETCPLASARASGQRERVTHLHHTPKGEEYLNIELAPIANANGDQVNYVEKMEPLRVAHGKAAVQGLIGRAPAFQKMLGLVARVAPSHATVLLFGESGTGKELVAHALHAASLRAHRPMVAVDCASLPENLFESELFGHERGAFTGANVARSGLVEAASTGTLFLDEIGDIPLPMQVKLLRLLETGTYRRVGSTELRPADVRVISATHRDLQQMVDAGTFREDLYYRLSTFPIYLPALRERREDIGLLAVALLSRLAPGRALRLAESAHQLLEEQEFAGNVRELRNLMERSSLLCDGDTLESHHIREAINSGRRTSVLGQVSSALTSGTDAKRPPRTSAAPTLKAIERSALIDLASNYTGKRADLAKQLGISERSLYRKLRSAK